MAASTTTNLLTHTQTDLSQGTPYTFWVAAKNYIGTGALSPSVVQLAASVPDQPASPTVAATHDSVSISWTAPNDGGVAITDYYAFVDDDNNGTEDFRLEATTSNTFHSISTGVSQGTTY